MGSQRILALDAQVSILDAVQDFFQGHGFEVDTCTDVVNAIEKVKNNKYAAVFVDPLIEVPGQAEGLDLVQYIHQKRIDTQVIILTAYIKPEMYRFLSKFSVSAVLKKPLPLPDLAQIVLGMLGN
jgi:DNA-binding NtrC family response regulator